MADQHGVGPGSIERAVGFKAQGVATNGGTTLQGQSSVKVLGLGCGNQNICQFRAGFVCFASLGSVPQSFKMGQVLCLIAGEVAVAVFS